MCILCVHVKINKRLFEPFCVWIYWDRNLGGVFYMYLYDIYIYLFLTIYVINVMLYVTKLFFDKVSSLTSGTGLQLWKAKTSQSGLFRVQFTVEFFLMKGTIFDEWMFLCFSALPNNFYDEWALLCLNLSACPKPFLMHGCFCVLVHWWMGVLVS